MLSLPEKINGMKNEPYYIDWPILNIYSKTIHAEMAAILSLLRKYKVSRYSKNKPKFPKKIYVVSFYTDKRLRISKPCEDCLRLLKYYGVKKVVYSISNDLTIQSVFEIKPKKSRGNLSK